MLKSTESIASLAAALARAQQELTNPEKSLTATLPPETSREEPRAYRYASLASGLDIVRKTLGRQEIAAIQSTVIDQQTGLVRLLTVLAHSSGEWLSSEWPVCPVAETANPQRMGAALTYARRYALFTLVGIAGEDDLDAPHPRPTPAPSTEHARNPGAALSSSAVTPRPKTNSSRQSAQRAPEPMLAAEDSAALREALLAELVLVQTRDGLARWAYRRLRSKNILQDADASAIEAAFQGKLDAATEFDAPPTNAQAPDATTTPTSPEALGLSSEIEPTAATGNTPVPEVATHVDRPVRSQYQRARSAKKTARAPHLTPVVPDSSQRTSPIAEKGPESVTATETVPEAAATPPGIATLSRRTAVDKSALHLDEPKRLRDKAHLRYVASQPCVLCSGRPSDAHHIRFAQPRALGRKVSDEFVVPLCRQHHRDIHDSGNEAAWWHDLGIDPIAVAGQLWNETLAARR